MMRNRHVLLWLELQQEPPALNQDIIVDPAFCNTLSSGKSAATPISFRVFICSKTSLVSPDTLDHFDLGFDRVGIRHVRVEL